MLSSERRAKRPPDAKSSRYRVVFANRSVVTAVRVEMARARSRGGPRWRVRSALVLLLAILAGVCLTGADSYAVLPVNHLTPKDFLAVPSTCDGVELINPTFPAANASVVYKEFSPDSGASRFLSHCVFSCTAAFQTVPGDRAVASARSRSRVSRVPARVPLAQTLRRGRAGTRVASPTVATWRLDPPGTSPPRVPSSAVKSSSRSTLRDSRS